MLADDAVVNGRLVERVSKAAKCLESGPSGWILVVVPVVVPAEPVEEVLLVVMVVEVAMTVDEKCGMEVVLVLVQMPATEMVLGRRVRGSRKSVLVDDAAAGEVAT